jgi:hypothetical protein
VYSRRRAFYIDGNNKKSNKKRSIPMNENTSNTSPKVFEIIDGNTLMAQEYEPLRFAVEKILPHGVFILAGSDKIGKSWLSLDLCVNVATGGKLWEFSSEQGDVLYLALEDNYLHVSCNTHLAHLRPNILALHQRALRRQTQNAPLARALPMQKPRIHIHPHPVVFDAVREPYRVFLGRDDHRA